MWNRAWWIVPFPLLLLLGTGGNQRLCRHSVDTDVISGRWLRCNIRLLAGRPGGASVPSGNCPLGYKFHFTHPFDKHSLHMSVSYRYVWYPQTEHVLSYKVSLRIESWPYSGPSKVSLREAPRNQSSSWSSSLPRYTQHLSSPW